jgi:hypothetical protein
MVFDPAVLQGLDPAARLTGVRKSSIGDVLPMPIVKHKGKTVFITQSMLKDFAKMEAGEGCPKQFYYKYIKFENVELRDTSSMNLGKRFEYILTGQTDKFGITVGPLLTGKGEKSAEEKRVRANADTASEVLNSHGFKFKRLVNETGEALSIGKARSGVSIHTQGMSGTLDLLCTKNGQKCIVDLKYSGLLGDKWSEFGWYWEDKNHPNYIGNNPYQRLQATQYVALYYLRFGKKLPFYYAVFDNRSGKEGNYRIFEMDISDDAITRHLMRIKEVAIALKAMLKTAHLKECEKNAFCPVGEFTRCNGCALAENCTRRVTIQDELKISI